MLTQAFGTKRVRLYGAAQTRFLYVVDAATKRSDGSASGGVEAQGNVSAIDVEAPDLARFPRFAGVERLEGVLGPGEGLLIPAGCWHHVRSLSPAFSVSFWF